MSHVPNEQIRYLLAFLSDYGVPLELEHIAILMDINNTIDKIIDMRADLPEGIDVYDPDVIEETVTVYDPCPPDGFYHSSYSDELLSLFSDVISDEYRLLLDHLEEGVLFDRPDWPDDIRHVAKKYFHSVRYSDSYGIYSYYDIAFELPPVLSLVDEAKYRRYGDLLYSALQVMTDDSAFASFLNRFEEVLEIPIAADEIAQCIYIQTPSDFASEFSSRFDIKLDFSSAETVDECLDIVASELFYMLADEILPVFMIISNELPDVVEQYNKIYQAFDETCSLFAHYCNEISEYYDQLDNWREFFEENQMYDILEELFGVRQENAGV